MYTSSWRYLYGVKEGAKRVDLMARIVVSRCRAHRSCSRQQPFEAKARVQAGP
ncbi:ProQ/FINO family protein [Escherichia coli]